MDIKDILTKENIKEFFHKFFKEEESGAIVVEATVSLFVAVSTIITFYSLLNIIRVQAQITQLVHETTMDLSQLYYFYYYLGPGKSNYKHSDKFKYTHQGYVEIDKALDISGEYTQEFSGPDLGRAAAGALHIWDFGAQGDFVGLLKSMVFNEVSSAISTVAVQEILSFMAKSSVTYNGMDRDKYYSLYKVNDFKAIPNTDKKKLHIAYTYTVGIMDPFNLGFKFKLGSSANTVPWYGR